MVRPRGPAPVNDSTRDAETERDERLLSAALRTRRAILTTTLSSTRLLDLPLAASLTPVQLRPGRRGK
ncbi:hypothetical protein [Streptomyces echinatus]|uniref:hypothetical protein n=1 Tax=Streptomyces echinatus TaxID=67293 RepID=UPI0037B56498